MDIFIELSLIIGITLVVSAAMKLLRQPLIVGYILSGILVSPYFLDIVQSQETIAVFSQMGITFLLFIVGLSLSPKVIREVGKVSLITGIGQILFTSLFGFAIASLLGFDQVTSFYIAIAITFSSTIIIMKLLSDKKDLEKLYGKISIGFLLVQDLFVILLLIVISSFSSSSDLSRASLELVFFGIAMLAALGLISVYIIPAISRFLAKSQELLFLFSIAWGMCLASLFHILGFSIEIGALVAGVTLSLSPYHYEINSRMKLMRDFFIILFFILLGSQMVLGDITKFIVPLAVFSLFILVGNPLVVMILMGILGYRKKTSFLAGLTVAQISEFSLIFIALGIKVGHISREVLSVVTLVGLVTIGGSSYLIMYSDRIYPHISKFLGIFERNDAREEKEIVNHFDVVLFGCNRVGHEFLKMFKKMKKDFLVVDYDPEVISELSDRGISCIYGDADDSEFLEELNIGSAKMVVSTIPSSETNIHLVSHIREINKDAIVVAVAHQIDNANELYLAGATYVIMPHFLGGKHASEMVGRNGLDAEKYAKERRRHIKYLEKKQMLGHEHPKPERHQ